MNSFIRIVSVVLLLVCSGFAYQADPAWRTLFNGKNLEGWDTYIGPPYDSTKKDFAGTPVGLNSDPQHVFSVAQEDGRKVLRVSGEQFGGISTKEEFENYHLQLDFKWGKLKWAPRDKNKRDSGVLYHAVGQHGKDWFFWMRSFEFQVQEGDCGDYWGLTGTRLDIPVKKPNEKEYVFDPGGELTTFSSDRPVGRHCTKSLDAEKPYGEWNTIDIYCAGDTSVHMINGKVVMVLYHTRQFDGDQEKSLTKGKIQIQSEGAEVYYSNIRIQPVRRIPKDLLQ